MARTKDATKDVPVENYRKQIGKQDYKKSKAELKKTKAQAQAKKEGPTLYRDMAILVFGIAFVMGVVYFFLFLYLENKVEGRI
ncbi:hypothetical protein HNY73_022853 [Argiope bruennichi]|uniref:Triple QxxK/R motif-containing protein n=1 Tax=Argiope bruennichi TaxID=94029 RepID=A0A8T0E3M3_ARGBR|nr:hypothetical protein HNY73_022853 [Argiope bruennichi]